MMPCEDKKWVRYDKYQLSAIIGLTTGFENACQDKIRFTARKYAKAYQKKIARKYGGEKKYIYKCIYCGCYHLGGKPGKKVLGILIKKFEEKKSLYMDSLYKKGIYISF